MLNEKWTINEQLFCKILIVNCMLMIRSFIKCYKNPVTNKGDYIVIETLIAHKQELENELSERIRALFEENNEVPGSVSIQMKLTNLAGQNNRIDILIKESGDTALLVET